MANNGASLDRLVDTGWRRGFGNLFRKENSRWWKTPMWFIQVLIWLAIINGIVSAVLFTRAADGQASQAQAFAALMIFFIFAGLGTAVGASVIMQDAIIDEKRSGTAAWVLSKPIARPAFILAKLSANALGVLVTAFIIQGAIGYLLFSLAGHPLGVGHFAMGIALAYLNVLFYLALTLMLGCLFASRGPVIGIPMALAFGYQFFIQLWPGLWRYMPWQLTVPGPGNQDALALLAAQGKALPTITPILTTILMIALFTAVAIWRFQREEF
jgi:ABC-2 type transport system permease protein